MARRSNGEGTIYKRKDGKWCASKYIDLPDGTCKRKYIYGKTQKAVKDRLKEFDESQKLSEDSNMLFQDWILQWLDKYKKNVLKQTTYENYRMYINTHIVGTKLGQTNLSKVTTGQLQSFYNLKIDGTEDREPLSRRSVEYIRTIIGGALKQACKNDLILKDVNKATVLPRKNEQEIIPLTIEELQKVIKVSENTKMYPLLMTEIYTGMRKGELLALRWDNIDFEAKCIHVRRNLCRVQSNEPGNIRKSKFVLMEPKTKRSIRVIPVTDGLLKILKQHKIRQNEVKMKNRDIYVDNNMVFARDDGGFEDPREILRRFHKLLDKAGVRKCRFHDLRHTFASILLNEGESMKVIQELLGHSTITTTMDIYSHVAQETKQRSIEILEKAMNQG